MSATDGVVSGCAACVHPSHTRAAASAELLFEQMYQHSALGGDQRVAARPSTPVQREHHAAVASVVLLPPARVGDAFVGIDIGQVGQIVVRHRYGKPVVSRRRRQSSRDRPRPQHTAGLKSQVVVVAGLVMFVQNKCRMRRMTSLGPAVSWHTPIEPGRQTRPDERALLGGSTGAGDHRSNCEAFSCARQSLPAAMDRPVDTRLPRQNSETSRAVPSSMASSSLSARWPSSTFLSNLATFVFESGTLSRN
jgi:hypothetical protein